MDEVACDCILSVATPLRRNCTDAEPRFGMQIDQEPFGELRFPTVEVHRRFQNPVAARRPLTNYRLKSPRQRVLKCVLEAVSRPGCGPVTDRECSGEIAPSEGLEMSCRGGFKTRLRAGDRPRMLG